MHGARTNIVKPASSTATVVAASCAAGRQDLDGRHLRQRGLPGGGAQAGGQAGAGATPVAAAAPVVHGGYKRVVTEHTGIVDGHTSSRVLAPPGGKT